MRWLAVLSLAAIGASASSPPLSIGLETSWPAPPLALEILEAVYDENPESYFPLLNLFIDYFPPINQPRTALEIATVAEELITSHSLLLPTELSLTSYKLALALHTSVPRIEAALSWYEGAIDEKELGVDGCGSWVEWRGKGFCELSELRNDVERSIEGLIHVEPKRDSLSFDRVPVDTDSDDHLAILYLDLDSASTAPFLGYLASYSKLHPSFGFAIRYKPTKSRDTNTRTGLSGYGVELALKNTDYLVVDDRDFPVSGTKQTAGPTEFGGKGTFSDKLGEDPWAELSTPLTKEELKDIGIKAVGLIKSSDDKLKAFQELSQDFPKYSAALARNVKADPAVSDKIKQIMSAGEIAQALYINGKPLPPNIDAFSLLKTIREERDLILSLAELGISPQNAIELLSDSIIGQAQAEDDPGDGVVDASDRPEGGQVITWWNDITKDKRYKQWPTQIQGYVRPIYSGQLHAIRQNTWNLVFVLDFTSAFALDTLVSSISTLIQRGLPVRFGLVPMLSSGDDDLSIAMAKVFLYTTRTFGRSLSRDLFNLVVQRTPTTGTTPPTVNLEVVRAAYDAISPSSKKAALAFDEVIKSHAFDEELAAIEQYCQRLLATKEESSFGHLFANGKHTEFDGQWPTFVQQEFTFQTQFLAQQIVNGVDIAEMENFFYDLPSTSLRRSKYIIPGRVERKLRIFNLPRLFKADPAKKLSFDFVYNENEKRGAPLSTWIVGDLDSAEARKLAEDALTYLQGEDVASRIGFIHVPNKSAKPSIQPQLSTVLYQLYAESALHTISPSALLDLFREFDKVKDNLDTDGNIQAEAAQKAFEGTPLNAFTSAGWGAADAAAAAAYWSDVGSKIGEQLGIQSTSPYLLINSRLIGPITPDSFFIEDFDTLEIYELRKRTKPVIDLLQTMYNDLYAFDRATLGNLISSVSSVIASVYAPKASDGIFTPDIVTRNRFYERIDKEGVLSFKLGNEETALLHVVAVVDPISKDAQRWSALLQTLAETNGVAVSVYLQPKPITTELDLKRFYRFTLPTELQFDVDGKEVTPGITFTDIPGAPILTLAMDTPPSWVVRPESSPYDLDNLVLGKIHDPIHILFNLNQIVIEGHAREQSNAPPRGLQLQLTGAGLETTLDTQVMANLGYFQFKATPGVYNLSIRPGRGTEVYDLESVGTEGWDSRSVNVTGTRLALDSFEGITILPRFDRKPGMEEASVLDEGEVKDDFPGSIVSMFKSIVGLRETPPASRHADINIFTVASGLLYERFASIMILSVMKNTNSSVKFWFIENFLSPTFLEFIPKMAEEYGFQYEFVTYKWPSWLRAQTEKQRIIWAYKILFLDVLFPMDLDKVIFVDADQIVRTDMKELVDLDLHGRVYGYPPMGDDREEMEGFRFWKTGYWHQVLRGRPYHISALYVVDLKRFRQLATGDRLRGQYHALSADPNSLANLDQDLPNSMQDQIPIFTLDKDWLWCQTWCSDESLATAKTIDLCQNPLTKEPKLVRARQIPEWDVYDREIAQFAASISGEEGALAASVDDLADIKSEMAPTTAEESISGEPAPVDDESRHRIEDEL